MELYSHPILNISNRVTVKITERNYLLWKSQFGAFLSGQGLLGFVTGAIPLPTLYVPNIEGFTEEVSNLDHIAWTRFDQVVQSWLVGSLFEVIRLRNFQVL